VNWMHLAQDREQCCCEHGNELSDFVKDVEFVGWLNDSASQEGFCSMKLVSSALCNVSSWRNIIK